MHTTCEKWFWIELIGFDVDVADCAVPALFERAGFIPDVVSLLLHNAEFIHRHRGADADWDFPADICSYGGHDRNEERQRQQWTPAALHRLVRVLHEHGARVFFSVFDSGMPAGWREHHPELGYVSSDGSRSPRICPWKRLADGTFYEDFFAERLRAVMCDYGFDGFHGADGYSHPKLPLHVADISDDMVGQFLDDTAEELPTSVSAPCDDDAAALKQRADWLWTECRRSWIEFHTRRIQRFWKTVATMLHKEEKSLALNTCWTRDPFESIYRFGVDCRLLAEAGADAFIVEAAGAVQELGGDLPYGSAYGRTFSDWDPSRILCRFQSTIMTIKAAVPDTKLVYLNGIKDTNEVWNGLRHAPTNLESEILMHGNVYLRRGNGSLSRCAAGPAICLADGIQPEEWHWLNQAWECAHEWPATRVSGATMVWSDTAASAHLDQYLNTRRCPTGRLLFELVAHGAPIYTAQRIEDLRETTEPLVVLYPELFAESELDALLAHARGPLMLIGDPLPRSRPDAAWTTSGGDAPMWCGMVNVTDDRVAAPPDPEVDPTLIGTCSAVEPPSWIYELPMQPIPTSFITRCAQAIIEVTDAPRVTENADSVRVWAVEGPDGRRRLFMRNDSFYYRVAHIDMRRHIRDICVRTRFPGRPIPFQGNAFHVKLPGKGMVVADIDLD